MDVEMYLNPRVGEEESIYLADPAVAKESFTQAAVLAAALDHAAVAEGILLSHRDKGHSHIDVSLAGEPDVLVSLVDAGGHAMGIEREIGVLARAFPIDSVGDLPREKGGGYRIQKKGVEDE